MAVVRLNPTFSNSQSTSDVAALLNRNFAVVWYDIGSNSGDIKLQLWNPTGGAVGSESIVNTRLAGNQDRPVVAALSNGGFVVAWDDLVPSPTFTQYNVKYRVYDSSGKAVTGELSAAAANNETRFAAVAGGPNGSFAITWANQVTGGHEGRLFNGLGQPTTGTVLIAPLEGAGTGGTLDGAVAISGGNYAFIFEDILNIRTGDGIYLRQTAGFPTGTGAATRIDPGTNIAGANPGTEGHDTPDIAFGGANGTTLAAVWSNQFGTGAARQNDIVLNFNGVTKVINTTTFGDQITPAIAALQDGGFLVVWNHTVSGTQNPTGSIQEIRGQQISPTGDLVGGEINFSNNGTSGTTSQPHVAVSGDGIILVTWTQAGPTTSGNDILGEFYQQTLTPTLPSTDANDTIVGTAGPDVIDARGGNDRITPGGGNDTVGGGEGGVDVVVFDGGRGSATLTINLLLTILADTTGNINGIDLLNNIERIRFSDGTLALDIALPGQGSSNAGSAYRLYEAAFNRTPDAPGLAFWINQLDAGMSVRTAAQGFVGSAEFQARYGANPSASQLVSTFYQNILERPPEQAGFDFWFGILNNRPDQRATVLEGIANSAENQDGLIGIIGQGIFLPGNLLI